MSSTPNSITGIGNIYFLARCITFDRPSASLRSLCCTSPFKTIVVPSPTLVSNIFSSWVVMFCVSSTIIKELSKLRPRISARGAISMFPFLMPVSTVPLPRCFSNTSNTGKAQGIVFSAKSPFKNPSSLPTATWGLVITILSIFFIMYRSAA